MNFYARKSIFWSKKSTIPCTLKVQNTLYFAHFGRVTHVTIFCDTRNATFPLLLKTENASATNSFFTDIETQYTHKLTKILEFETTHFADF